MRPRPSACPPAAAPDPLHYTASGLPDVWLLNGFHRDATPDGPAVRIEDADGLHAALARAIVTARKILTPAELRFLRAVPGMAREAVARRGKREAKPGAPAPRLVMKRTGRTWKRAA